MTNSSISDRLISTSVRRICGVAVVACLFASCGGSEGSGASTTSLDSSSTTSIAPTDSSTMTSDGVEPATTITPTTDSTATTAPPATTAAAPTTVQPATEAATTTAPAAVPAPTPGAIPAAIQGVWRQSDAASVTAAECDEASSPDNIGKVLTIAAGGFSNFEDGGRLLEVYTSDASNFEARYDTTYADTPTEDRLLFSLQDGGTVLLVSDVTRPGTVRYVRCP